MAADVTLPESDFTLPGSGYGRELPIICGIYRLIDPRTGGTRYVGQSNDICRRFRNEIWEATHYHKTPVQKWIAKLLGMELLPIVKIVAEAPEASLDRLERGWVAYYRTECPLLNVLDGGGQDALRGWHKGKKRPEAWRNNMAAAQRAALERDPGLAKRRVANRQFKPKNCRLCGQEFTPLNAAEQYCSRPECRSARKELEKEDQRERARVRDSKRRAERLEISQQYATEEMPINPAYVISPRECLSCAMYYIPTNAKQMFCLKPPCREAAHQRRLALQRERRKTK